MIHLMYWAFFDVDFDVECIGWAVKKISSKNGSLHHFVSISRLVLHQTAHLLNLRYVFAQVKMRLPFMDTVYSALEGMG